MAARTPRFAILSRTPTLYSTVRLVEAAREAGAEPLVLDTLRCSMVIQPGGSQFLYKNQPLPLPDVVVPRIGHSITGYGMAVVNQLDSMGVPVLNGAAAIARSRDKVRCLQLLSAARLDVPLTVMAHEGVDVEQLVSQVGGLPCIIKLVRGTQGVGVMLAETLREAESMVAAFRQLGQEVCLQEFVAESKGRDVRALVVGQRVVGAMRRTAQGDEFRSNIHRGAEGVTLTLDKEYTEIALKAAAVIGLEICGVDLLEGKAGPRVMELNSSPGFEGLEKATGRDIAGEIARHALTRVST